MPFLRHIGRINGKKSRPDILQAAFLFCALIIAERRRKKKAVWPDTKYKNILFVNVLLSKLERQILDEKNRKASETPNLRQ